MKTITPEVPQVFPARRRFAPDVIVIVVGLLPVLTVVPSDPAHGARLVTLGLAWIGCGTLGYRYLRRVDEAEIYSG